MRNDSTPAGTATPDDVRPLVAQSTSNRGVWIFAGALLIAALALFLTLDARRTQLDQRTAPIAGSDQVEPIESPTALVIPNIAPGRYYPGEAGTLTTSQIPNFAATPFPSNAYRVAPGVPTGPRVIQPTYLPGPPISRPSSTLDQSYMGPPPPIAQQIPQAPVEQVPAGPVSAGDSVVMARIANPATTIPQGAIIPAVMETALDSNRGGFARAIVSRNVRGFDGTTVLIPRGSRLFGEYKSDIEQGQNRMFVQWQRLTLPNGSRVTLNSPVADPLGRAGVRGKVDNHFWQRFGPALLQSTIDIGAGLATRGSNGPAIIGLPGSTQFINPAANARLRPTIRVQQGASVSVFVARDLDFTSIER